MEAMGPVKKSVFSNISLTKSVRVQVHKLYINLAIAVILMLFSSLSVSDLKICPIRRGSSCILRNENQLLVHNFKVSVASKYLLLHDMDEY